MAVIYMTVIFFYINHITYTKQLNTKILYLIVILKLINHITYIKTKRKEKRK